MCQHVEYHHLMLIFRCHINKIPVAMIKQSNLRTIKHRNWLHWAHKRFVLLHTVPFGLESAAVKSEKFVR